MANITNLRRFLIYLILFKWISLTAVAQLSIHHGVTLPTRDTIRALIIFAEVDYADGPCPKDFPDEFLGQWTILPDGSRGLPENAGVYLDPFITSKPYGYITSYYYEASFGQYVLLGDYLPYVVSVPCHQIKQGLNLDQTLRIINQKMQGQPIITTHGIPLSAFDNWSEAPAGEPKLKKPDGKIDLVYLIWRNNRFLNGYNTWDNSGYGVTPVRGIPFGGMQGVNNAASYNNSWGDEHGFNITIAEHLHAIFGGNHWHSGGGRGIHTFLAIPYNYGLTGQLEATMQAVCGWDRWMMQWKNPEKKYLISALDTSLTEQNTEYFSLNNNPDGGLLYLRDHVKTGDAIRIRLPFLNWQKEGDVKNQYLWLEYRDFTTRFDQYMNIAEECSDHYDEYPSGTPGLYAYIQVGKDQREGKDIYSARPASPNGLASWLLPLTAEGNYDFYYRYDKIPDPLPGCGSWGNTTLPLERSKSKPNPFTGHSDLFRITDSNHDGLLYSGDDLQPGLADMLGDSVWFNYHRNGDKDDAFCFKNKKTKLSISTNPSPVPVYTYAADLEYNRFYFTDGSTKSQFENRTIALNGLSIEIVKEYRQEGAILIRIRWDDYIVNNSVRWCGNIELHPHVFDTMLPSLSITKGKIILLDRSQSPTYHTNKGRMNNSEYWFSDTTQFRALTGAYIQMQAKSRIELKNGSHLILDDGALLEMGKGSRIIIEKGSDLLQQPNAKIVKGKGAKIIIK
ncbi:MAG: hypothetical protein LC101_00380 [Flavobacteriales bacterium]|nr:hypothetical protein [Flavobacteriales bacterium]